MSSIIEDVYDISFVTSWSAGIVDAVFVLLDSLETKLCRQVRSASVAQIDRRDLISSLRDDNESTEEPDQSSVLTWRRDRNAKKENCAEGTDSFKCRSSNSTCMYVQVRITPAEYWRSKKSGSAVQHQAERLRKDTPCRNDSSVQPHLTLVPCIPCI